VSLLTGNEGYPYRASAYLPKSKDWFFSVYFSYGTGLVNGRYDDLTLEELQSISPKLTAQGWKGTLSSMSTQLSHIAIDELYWKASGLSTLHDASPVAVNLLLRYRTASNLSNYVAVVLESLHRKLCKYYDIDEPSLARVLGLSRNKDGSVVNAEQNLVRFIGLSIIEDAGSRGGVKQPPLFSIFEDVARATREISLKQ
jgi:hypothetical protein